MMDSPYPGLQQWGSLDPSASLFLTKNLDELRTHEPVLADLIQDSAESLGDYEFMQTASNQFRCRLKSDQRELYPPGDLAQSLLPRLQHARQFYQRGVKVIGIAGSGLGYLAVQLEQEIRNHERAIIMIEPRPELVLAQFCLFSCRNLAKSFNAFWAVGEPLDRKVRDLIVDGPLFHVEAKHIAMVPERGFIGDEGNRMKSLAPAFAAWHDEAVKRIDVRCEAYDRRMKEPPDLDGGTVWASSNIDAYAHTPLKSAIMDGMASFGWKKAELNLRDGFCLKHRAGESIITRAPDLLLFVNAPSNLYVAPDTPRPRATLMLDNPRNYSPERHQELLSDKDFVFYIDRSYGEFFDGTNAHCARFMPAWSTIDGTGTPREELKCPIVFAGSHTPSDEYTKGLSSSIKDAFFAAADLQIEDPQAVAEAIALRAGLNDEAFEALRQKAIQFTGTIQRTFDDDADRMNYFLYAFSNSVKRERYIRPLLDLGIVLYGPDSWRGVLGPERLGQYRGWLHGDDLADVYASAEICLNIHSLQCPTCLNPRDFDIVASGSCLVGDEMPDAHEGILKPGKDMLIFNTPEQLKEQVKELLADKDRRDRIAAQGHETWKAKHTPRHRARFILETIRDKYRYA